MTLAGDKRVRSDKSVPERRRRRGGTRRVGGAGGIYGASTSARAYECGRSHCGLWDERLPGSGG